MREPSRLPAVSDDKLPDTVAVTVSARAQRARMFSSGVDVDIANGSPSPLICDIRGKSAGGEVQLEPGYVWIDPQTTGTLHVRVGLRLPSIQAVVVRMRDSSREYLSETALQTPIALRLLPVLAACVILVIAAILFSGAFFPKVQALTAPSRVLAGDPVEADYATAGARTLHYSVRTASGVLIAGTLTQASGTIRFATNRAGGTYTIALSAFGIGDSASAQRVVIALTPPPRPVLAAIRDLDVLPPVATSGTAIAVHYSANAQSGTVRLLDASGTPWDALPYDRHGSVILRAPHVDAPEHFTIRIDVRDGASTARAATGVVVLPSPSPSPSASPSSAPPSSAPPAAVGRVVTKPGYIISGTYFSVSLRGTGGLVTGRATLQNATGTPLESKAFGPDGDATFIAPGVKRATTFFVQVNAKSGKAGQLMVAPVVIHPH